MTKKNKILITGSAGFIGFHLTNELLENGYDVIGIDNLNDYYEVGLKKNRLKLLKKNSQNTKGNFKFHKIDLCNQKKLKSIFFKKEIKTIVHLAAQAGVRYSLQNSQAYVDSNLNGFSNILNLAKEIDAEHFLFASSSSVYGKNKKIPFSESDKTDNPVSFYAATKKSNEVLAYSYSHLYNLPITGMRFFTVYGPYGRPDMAYFNFTKSILQGKEIKIFNNGKMKRDFTHIDDAVRAIKSLIFEKPDIKNQLGTSATAPYAIYNIGNNNPVTLLKFVQLIEKSTGIKAKKKLINNQLGDVPITYADISKIKTKTGFFPKIKLEDGINEFVKWYISYFK